MNSSPAPTLCPVIIRPWIHASQIPFVFTRRHWTLVTRRVHPGFMFGSKPIRAGVIKTCVHCRVSDPGVKTEFTHSHHTQKPDNSPRNSLSQTIWSCIHSWRHRFNTCFLSLSSYFTPPPFVFSYFILYVFQRRYGFIPCFFYVSRGSDVLSSSFPSTLSFFTVSPSSSKSLSL